MSDTPNQTTTCVRLPRVYDLVTKRVEQNAIATIPTADLAAVIAAVSEDHTLTVTVTPDFDSSAITLAGVSRVNEEYACATFRSLLVSTIEIYDETADESLSLFTQTIQLFDSSDVCFPSDLPLSAIEISVRDGVAAALSPIPFEGTLTIAYSVCHLIAVELEVYAQVQILEYCQSRSGSSCLGSVACPAGSLSYPANCGGAVPTL